MIMMIINIESRRKKADNMNIIIFCIFKLEFLQYILIQFNLNPNKSPLKVQFLSIFQFKRNREIAQY